MSATAALPASRLRRRIRRYGLAWAGGAIVLAWILVAIFAPWIAPFPPDAQDIANRLASPSASFTARAR